MSTAVAVRSATALFRAQAERLGERTALRTRAEFGARQDVELSWAEWHEHARRFAAALVASRCRPGERVAILAQNRTLWPIADLGTMLAGQVPVGIYPTSAPAQVERILADCGATVVVTDTAEQLHKVLSVRGRLPSLRTVVSLWGLSREPVVGWGRWQARGRASLEEPGVAEEVERRAESAGPDDVALLIYTSGSTGEPRGARIPHRALLASVASIRDALGLEATDTTLSFLPFCHAAERVFGQWTRILCGIEAMVVPDPARVWDAARAYGPTLFGGLPRFYEKAFETLETERAAAAGSERERWERVLELGRARSRLRRAGDAVPDALEREWRGLGEPLFERVRAIFGGRVRRATSGGATLPVEVAETLDALGLTVLGAYGLTEHLCAAFNRPDAYTFDSAGPAMPGTELRIADDGEILIRRSELTFDGYHGRPAESAQAFTDDGAWLRTGDLGALDARGFLRVTGRKKELIALSTGKKVAPLPIEARLVEHPWIAQAVLHGEGRKFVSALIALRRPVVEAWARAEGIEAPFEALLSHPALVARVQAAVDAVNAELSRTEQLRRFVLLERELSLEADELTPTLKIRRHVVAERYRDRLDALYG